MKVVFLDTVHPILNEELTANGYNCIDASAKSMEQCVDLLKDAIGIVIRSRFSLDKNILDHCKNLKFIARSGAGMENIDIDYCNSRNITLYNAPEGNRNAVAEHALGMLLSLFNNLNKGDSEIRNGTWDREGNRGIELDGKTIGIIGYGNNGSAFIKKLSGFDVEILVYDKYKSGFSNNQIKEATLSEIQEKATVLSFHIPQNEETIYFGNSSFFDGFLNNFYLINLSRGKIIKTADLVAAIKSTKILGACLDVLEYEKSSFESFFEQEITPDFEYLLQSEKVILSPHVGGWTKESYYKLSKVLSDKILANS
jgi:D-3-phosphoglycerate dehydrogenase